MKRTKLLPALLLLLSLALFLAGCGSDSAATRPAPAADANFAPSGGSSQASSAEYPYEPEYDGGIADVSAPGSAAGGSYYENTKVILTASLDLQTTDFDGAMAALDELVSNWNGYYENSNYNYGGYYSSNSRWGQFSIRVPKENYTPFLTAVSDVAHLISRNTETQDVGEAYYDAELHLETLNTKHERLLALLDQATIMEDIIALESALSDVEYQIQQYTSTLTRYDGLIDFATIYVSLQEVVRVADNPSEADPLSTRIGAAFTKGWNNFCDGMADFAVWAAYNFIGIMIFLALVAAAVILFVRLRAAQRRRFSPPTQPKDEDKP